MSEATYHNLREVVGNAAARVGEASSLIDGGGWINKRSNQIC